MKYIIVCGPTCSGKTSLGIQLARKLGGEIIGADSRQIYKKVNLGTAKPAPDEYSGLKYHLIDFLDLSENFSAFKYGVMARKLIAEINDNGKIPIVVGGTGLYLKAVTDGFFQSPEPDNNLREELELKCREAGLTALYDELALVDPETAGKLSPNDKVRIIRALEIFRQTGIPISIHRRKGASESWGQPLWIGLNTARPTLYGWINSRVDTMIQKGWEEELRGLLPDYEKIMKKRILGYVDMFNHIVLRKFDRRTAIDLVKQHHRNYAKRQLTWFAKVKQIMWFDPAEQSCRDKVYCLCADYLKRA